MLVVSELLPKVQNLQAGRQKTNTAGAITDFLQSVTLIDVLPPRPEVHPRRFMVCTSCAHLYLANVSPVVGCFHRLAHFVDLGRDLRAWNVASGNLELYQCSVVLREAHPDATASDYGNNVECRWWIVFPLEAKARSRIDSIEWDCFYTRWRTILVHCYTFLRCLRRKDSIEHQNAHNNYRKTISPLLPVNNRLRGQLQVPRGSGTFVLSCTYCNSWGQHSIMIRPKQKTVC